MIKPISQKWKSFRQRVNNWLLTMDADPLEDLHCRVRRLEAAINAACKLAKDGAIVQEITGAGGFAMEARPATENYENCNPR
jgi:hypothetical protein